MNINFRNYKLLTEQVNFINDFHTLGIPRSQMPQIKSYRVPEFEKYLEDEGYTLREGKAEVDKLKLTQADINMNKVIGMVHNINRIEKKFVIVSSDNYILDGHHRIFAMQLAYPKQKVPIHKVNVKIRELLNLAHKFEGSTRES